MSGRSDSPAGVGLAFAAYGIWGLFPLYFALLSGIGPVEVVAHRVIWSLAFCLLLLWVAGAALGRSELRRLTARRVLGLAAAAGVLSVNWVVFVYAVTSGQVVQASLGYFTNPLVSVLLGVVILRERLRPAQWVAVGIAAVAVVVLTVDAGAPPWIALALAFSFGLYGLLKNRVGQGVGALPGMTVETAVLFVPALALVLLVEAGGGGHVTASPTEAFLLIGTGPLTAGALLVFAAAARRIRLSTLGLIQYLTPSMHLVGGLLVLGETMTPGRWVGFAVVWVALVVFTADSLRIVRRNRRARREATVAPP